jgi:hypothetical protein
VLTLSYNLVYITTLLLSKCIKCCNYNWKYLGNAKALTSWTMKEVNKKNFSVPFLKDFCYFFKFCENSYL